MAESHVVSGLVAKRSELTGLVNHYQAEIRRIAADLAHVDAAIKLFDPDYDLRTVKPTAVRVLNPWFEHGDVGRWALDALRLASVPLSTREIAENLIEKSGKTVHGRKEWDHVLKLVLGGLRRLESKGRVRMAGKAQGPRNAPILWELV